ncbi:helix-loop-helix protein delilah-like [Cimex lectularius]|uniref:BHLH domain-containing protein n=1 Tax=Cimex lectularius TaxID=79782 RepID=A0A8I6TCN8_CIMLE|nr:helix-loop-helix protein delilah-like [Cimex lectularius]
MAEVLEEDPNNNSQGEKSYSLRPRTAVKRSDEEEEETVTWRRRPKRRQKPKPAPLSKYRRKTANARERCRMREINEAFDSLRRAVPHSESRGEQPEKLTKISTLRLAMKYIAALTAALSEPPQENQICLLPPTPPVSDSPLSPPPDPEITSFTDFQDFDPFAHTALDLDDFFFA